MALTTGVVVGKFYPPHLGHQFLIEQGCQQVDHLSVLVCDHPDQLISAELRASWLSTMCPKAHIMITPDDLPEDPNQWGKRTTEVLGHQPDFVFSSEEYGWAYADAMGATHILVDRERVHVPISATKIKSDVSQYWSFLPNCVRSHMVPRVVLIGAESTGKTTLAQILSEHFQVPWIPEVGREYSERIIPAGMDWRTQDFLEIAKLQQARESEQAQTFPNFLVCDTNAWTTSVWHERYMGFADQGVDAVGKNDRADFYFLCDPDVPFVQDGLRDGEHLRTWMHERFLERLSSQRTPLKVLTGTYEHRIQTAIDCIQKKNFMVSFPTDNPLWV